MGGENEKKNMKYEGLWTCLVLPFHNRVEQAGNLAGEDNENSNFAMLSGHFHFSFKESQIMCVDLSQTHPDLFFCSTLGCPTRATTDFSSNPFLAIMHSGENSTITNLILLDIMIAFR